MIVDRQATAIDIRTIKGNVTPKRGKVLCLRLQSNDARVWCGLAGQKGVDTNIGANIRDRARGHQKRPDRIVGFYVQCGKAEPIDLAGYLALVEPV